MTEPAPQPLFDAMRPSSAETAAASAPGRLQRLLRHPTAIFALAMIALFVVAALFAPWLTPCNPLAINPGYRFRTPGYQHLFGTDHLGRDIFAIFL